MQKALKTLAVIWLILFGGGSSIVFISMIAPTCGVKSDAAGVQILIALSVLAGGWLVGVTIYYVLSALAELLEGGAPIIVQNSGPRRAEETTANKALQKSAEYVDIRSLEALHMTEHQTIRHGSIEFKFNKATIIFPAQSLAISVWLNGECIGTISAIESVVLKAQAATGTQKLELKAASNEKFVDEYLFEMDFPHGEENKKVLVNYTIDERGIRINK